MAASINLLPQNVLYEIFLQYLAIPRIRNLTKPAVRCSDETFSNPLPLSHVCSTWRHVACSSPVLWSSIFVLGPSAKQLRLVQLWLERSGNLPLTLGFSQKRYWETVPELCNATNELLRLYLRHSERWKMIDFSFNDESAPPIPIPAEAVILFSCPNLNKLPLLEVVRIVDSPHWTIGHKSRLSTQIFQNKLLRSVSCGIAFGHHANITELICEECVSYQAVHQILKGFPNLEAFDIAVQPSDAMPSSLPEPTPLTHRKLQQFRLKCRFPGLILPILRNLTAPNLVQFECYDHDQGFIKAMNDMVLRSNCYLQSLRMIHVSQPATEDIIKFFALPQLRCLIRLGVSMANTAVLEWLTRTSNLPLLMGLEISGVKSQGSVLSDLLVSRFDSLQRIVVLGGPELDEMPLSDKLWSHPGLTIHVHDGKTFHDLLKAHPKRQIRRAPPRSTQ